MRFFSYEDILWGFQMGWAGLAWTDKVQLKILIKNPITITNGNFFRLEVQS